jgi:hypothetical protein
MASQIGGMTMQSVKDFRDIEQIVEKLIRENQARGLANYIWTGIGSNGRRGWFHAWYRHPAIGSIVFQNNQCYICDGFAHENEAFNYTDAEGFIASWLLGSED